MNEDIRLYSIDFKLLCIIHRVISSNWEIYYNKIGTFEAHISVDEYITPVIFDTEYIIACEGDKQAFITGKTIQDKKIILYGKTLNYLLSKRTVLPFNTEDLGIENNPVIFCNRLLNDVFISDREVETVEGTAVIPGVSNMQVFDNSEDFETNEKKFYRTEEHPLSEVLIERLDDSDAGHKLVFDTNNKFWRFEIFKGKEIPFVFSPGNKTLYDVEYTEDIQNYYSGGFYEEGSGEETESTENTDKKYFFVSLPEYENVPAICRFDTSLTGTGKNEALENLKTKTKTQELQGTAERGKFGIDYELGDVAKTQFINSGLKRTVQVRVKGVKIYKENNGIEIEPILEEIT